MYPVRVITKLVPMNGVVLMQVNLKASVVEEEQTTVNRRKRNVERLRGDESKTLIVPRRTSPAPTATWEFVNENS